jgi:hypothetical protein
MKKVNGSIKLLSKVKSLNGGALKVGAKTKCMRNPMESQLLIRNNSKVVQKISSFGPAHAEQARKLFGHSNIRNVRRENVPFNQMLPNLPMLRIARITPRPTGKYAMKSDKSSDVEFSSNSKEVFVREEPSKLGDNIRQKGTCLTILEMLGELSL